MIEAFMFEELQPWFGEALEVMRDVKGVTREELQVWVQNRIGSSVNDSFVADYEDQIIFLSRAQLVMICSLLGVSISLIYEGANSIREYSKLPEDEQWRLLEEEIKYRLWRLEEIQKELDREERRRSKRRRSQK